MFKGIDNGATQARFRSRRERNDIATDLPSHAGICQTSIVRARGRLQYISDSATYFLEKFGHSEGH